MVSHHVLLLVHSSSVLGLALRLSRIVRGFKTRLPPFFYFYLPFSIVINDIILFVLGYSSCLLSLFLKDSLLVALGSVKEIFNIDYGTIRNICALQLFSGILLQSCHRNKSVIEINSIKITVRSISALQFFMYIILAA